MANIWVFGYGSLMWDNSAFHPLKIIDATLYGWHRDFNKKSTESVGSREKPGLALGLSSGGLCIGKALQVDEKYLPSLNDREKGYSCSSSCDIRDSRGSPISGCIVYIPNNPVSYSLEEKARIMISAAGKRSNLTYFKNTIDALRRIGFRDQYMDELDREISRIQSEPSHPHTHLLSSAITDVEVYDSPKGISNSELVIGVPKEIRDALRIDLSNNSIFEVLVTNRRWYFFIPITFKVKVKIQKSDSRLTSTGDSMADNPKNHCWMTPEVRRRLHLKEIHASHRQNLPAFNKEFSSVSIRKA